MTLDMANNGYRLPTEAEWEFAARGGNIGHGYRYAGSDAIDTVAWYDANSGSTTHTVGTKAANELGLYDMGGNVWEWCWDYYERYTSVAQTNPTGAVSESWRMKRGGSWKFGASIGTVTYRSFENPFERSDSTGFRVVRQ